MSKAIHSERILGCPICNNIEDAEYVDLIREPEATLPPELRQLDTVKTLGYAYPELLRCPICATYYLYNVDCGWMEHDKSLERITDEKAKELIGPDLKNDLSKAKSRRKSKIGNGHHQENGKERKKTGD